MQKINHTNFFEHSLICENSTIKLRPIVFEDAKALKAFATEKKIWQYVTYKMQEVQDMENYVREAMSQRQLKSRYHFVIEDQKTDKLIGSSAFSNYSEKDSRIEIGWSWLDTEAQGKNINKNAKFLLLNLAFDYLNIERVEFKTDMLNSRARGVLIKIGAIEEGILRKHTLMPDGRRRDTVYYSILRDEWHDKIKSVNFSDCINQHYSINLG